MHIRVTSPCIMQYDTISLHPRLVAAKKPCFMTYMHYDAMRYEKFNCIQAPAQALQPQTQFPSDLHLSRCILDPTFAYLFIYTLHLHSFLNIHELPRPWSVFLSMLRFHAPL